jgi:hypothetical protein
VVSRLADSGTIITMEKVVLAGEEVAGQGLRAPLHLLSRQRDIRALDLAQRAEDESNAFPPASPIFTYCLLYEFHVPHDQ